MTAAEVIGTIREHLEGQFPKVCSVCKRSYVNFVVMTHVSDFEFRISKPKCLCLKWAVDVVYAPACKWPGGTFTLKSVRAKAGSRINLLGTNEPLPWSQDSSTG